MTLIEEGTVTDNNNHHNHNHDVMTDIDIDIEADINNNNTIAITTATSSSCFSTNTSNERQTTMKTTITTDTDNHPQPQQQQQQLSLTDAVVMLTAWATAGVIITIPYIYGQIGYALGSVLLVIVMSCKVYTATFLLKVSDQCKPGTIHKLGDVGEALAGQKGRILFEFFQMTNLLFYLPVALETVSISLQYLSSSPSDNSNSISNCSGMWNIITCVLMYVLIQLMNNWYHMTWLGYLSASIVAIKAYAFLPYTYVTYQDEIISSTDYMGPSQAIGNPDPTWQNYAVALAGIVYAGAPVFILFEVRSSMKEPQQMKKAVYISSFLQLSMFLVAGITAVALWGWNVTDPINQQIPKGWVGDVINITIVLATMLDYCIASKVTNSWFKATFLSSWSDTIGTKLLYTLPTTIVAISCVLLIPEFSTMIGILSSVTIVSMTSWAVPFAWELGGRAYQANRKIMMLVLVVGILVNVFALAGSIDAAATATYSFNMFCG